MHATLPLLRISDFPPLHRRRLDTLQVTRAERRQGTREQKLIWQLA
jgi:hypothetical protein